MKKPRVLGITVGVALLATITFSLHWTHENVALSLDHAHARVSRPLTTGSVVRSAHRKADGSVRHGEIGGGAAGGYYYNRPLYY